MSEASPHPAARILRSISAGEAKAASELLPVVYKELRHVAHRLMGHLRPGQTLQPTALVHEAYLRVAGSEDPGWEGRRHFFAAAAHAMRDILVEEARRKSALKRGGGRERVTLEEAALRIEPPSEYVLALNEALKRLEQDDPRKGQIVLHRYFAGLTIEETAEVLGLSHATVEREWRYTRAWLHKELSGRSDVDA